MPLAMTVYRVLIASPSDTAASRAVIRDTILNTNSVFSQATGVILQPVMWEVDVFPEAGDRPQALINRQIVADADMIIGTFWTKFGSPTGIAESGTAEEIQQFLDAQKPVMLYFSNAAINPQKINAEQFARVQAFKKEMQSRTIYGEYDSDKQLGSRLTMDLARVIQKLAQDNPRATPVKNSGAMLAIAQFLAYVDQLEAEWKKAREEFNRLSEVPRMMATENGYNVIKNAERPLQEHARKMYGKLDNSISFAVSDLGSKAFEIAKIREYYWANTERDGPGIINEFWREGEGLMNQIRAVRAVVESVS